MNELRLIDRLTSYWNIVRKERPIPEFAHFNASAIEDIWQQCVLFHVLPVHEGAPSIKFFMVGDKARQLYGEDMTGKTFNAANRKIHGRAMVPNITDVLTSNQPVRDEGHFVNANHKVVKYRSCLLPFGTDGKITHIIAGLSWKEF